MCTNILIVLTTKLRQQLLKIILIADYIRLTVQIYNIKKALSRVFVKIFYHKFWKRVKLFNNQRLTAIKNFSTPRRAILLATQEASKRRIPRKSTKEVR